MKPADIPGKIVDYIGDISKIASPLQGLTSEVSVIENADRKFVLKHSKGMFTEWLRFEHQVLLTLKQSRLPITRVHKFIDDQEDGKDECWLLTDYIRGEQLTQKLSEPDLAPDDRRKLFYACGSALAAVHATPLPPCIKNESDIWLDKLLSRASIAQRERALMFDKEIAETEKRHENLSKLENTRPSIERFTLIHGDCATDHFLFDGLNLTGIIDWGCATIGDPHYDIAQTLCVPPDWATTEITDDVAAFFEGYGTPPISIAEMQYYQELYDMGGQGRIEATNRAEKPC